MTCQKLNIIIVESSYILYEGLVKALFHLPQRANIHHAAQLKDTYNIPCAQENAVFIVSPSILNGGNRELQNLRNDFAGSRWVGLVYQFFDERHLAQFDGLISIFDTPEKIAETIDNLVHPHKDDCACSNEKLLSEREIEVLAQLALGLSNKEIAEKLNISVSTVISHRKNISQKTGIKSVSGLTIYAVVNKHITIEM